ncbi:hypothetical protein F5Y12DRAFT_735403 [Xylaria sp. FL1777]|nr:hypothetical protein F5Y12DRAFT_735403 [Xylaria sp. FL1777]
MCLLKHAAYYKTAMVLYMSPIHSAKWGGCKVPDEFVPNSRHGQNHEQGLKHEDKDQPMV